MFPFFKNSIEHEISDLSKQIIQEIQNEENFKTESVGITNGIEIIQEYLNNKEFELAFEHLEYIISECEFNLTSDQTKRMDVVSHKLGKTKM
jgi:hypothetical protein